MRPRHWFLFAVSLCPAILLAQTHHGTGISGGIGERIAVDYVREHWGPPDSVRLAVVAIWRGRTAWGYLVGESEQAQAKRSVDSASALSRQRRRVSAGTITPRGTAWIEYDAQSRTAFVADTAFKVPAGDSTLVLLIDDVDRIDGAPRAVAITIPHDAYPDDTRAVRPDSGHAHDPMVQLQAAWESVLRRNPVIRDFLDARSTP